MSLAERPHCCVQNLSPSSSAGILVLRFQWLSSIKFRIRLIYKFLDQQGVPRWPKENESVKLTVNSPFKFPFSSHPAVLAWGESSMTNFSSKACAYISISRDQTNRLLMGNWNSGIIPRWKMNQETVWLRLFFHFGWCVRTLMEENKKR